MFDPEAEAERVLAACKIKTWREKVLAEQQRLGRAMCLCELIELAKIHPLTATEIEEQRQSWARQMMD